VFQKEAKSALSPARVIAILVPELVAMFIPFDIAIKVDAVRFAAVSDIPY